jgi:hypothetical protein
MTTYIADFDESGIHAGADTSVMAGFVGEARQWRKFEKRISRLDHCGYEIVQKPHAEASLVPSACDDEVVPHVEHSH